MSLLLSWHRPGRLVVCIDDAPRGNSFHPGEIAITRGDIYTFRDVAIRRDLFGRPRVAARLVERPDDHNYFVDRFRPVRETSIGQLRALLNPSPEIERAFAAESADA